MRAILGHLRALLRMVLLAVTLSCLVISWILPLLVGLFSKRAKAHLRVRQASVWARVALRVMGIRVTRDGDAPRPPFFLVSNHLSYIDVLVLWSQVDVYFLAKSELGGWPVLGPLIRAAGTLFIDRSKARGVLPAIEAVREKLSLDCGTLVFAEGTSSSGESLLPLRTNLFEVPARGDFPVRVACLHYATDDPRHPPRMEVAWWGDMAFGGHFYRLLTMRRVRARVRFAPEEIHGSDRKVLAAEVAEVMERIFEPVPEA